MATLDHIEVDNPETHHRTFKYLRESKEKGMPMFKNTKVGSCSRVV